MSTHFLFGTTIAAVVAVSAAGHAVAQTQPPAGPGGSTAAPAYDAQHVTVEGCLYRERARSGAAALEIAGDPENALVFLLEKAEVLSRTDVTSGTAAAREDESAGPAEIENERLGVPTGRSGDAAAPRGTTGTPGERASSRSEPAAVEGSPTPYAERYVIVGLEDERLKLFAGRRVALSGQFEPAAVHERPDAGRAPEGAPATLPQFRASSVKPVAGICPPKP